MHYKYLVLLPRKLRLVFFFGQFIYLKLFSHFSINKQLENTGCKIH